MYVFIESSIFERIRDVYLDDDEYAELQEFLSQQPEAGRVVPGSGGVGSSVGRAQVWGNAEGCASFTLFSTRRKSFGC